MSNLRKAHWEQVYATRESTEVSWYQPVPEKSLQLIRATGAPHAAPILDVGGGASTLVDHLLESGFSDISVLDIASGAFGQSRARLGPLSDQVTWIVSDIIAFVPSRLYAVWHDRAVFHFLTGAAERNRYLSVLRESLQPGGHLLLATFGPQGPRRCSGLDTQRYSVADLQDLLGADFTLRAHELDQHSTPTGSGQQFLYTWWQYGAEDT
ncbi:MAG: methyltransferase domain-containing protein [Gammaproteobacteria bacterium]|nr:methyltransferase domain-containing protein [Gammaproteobacteria bacterium]